MRTARIVVLSLAALLTVGCQHASSTDSSTDQLFMAQPYLAYGASDWSDDTPRRSVAEAVTRMDALGDGAEEVVLTGVVNDVCKRRGCWLTMTAPGLNESVFVKFTCPIDGRLIPMDAMGKHVAARGKLERVEVTEAFARHLKEDAGASPEEIAAVKGPQKMLRLASPGARVYGLEAGHDE
jgi:hypothetical protein